MLADVRIRMLQATDFSSLSTLLSQTLEQSILQKLGARFIENYFLPQSCHHAGLYSYVCRFNNKNIGYALFSYPENSIQQLGKKLTLPLLSYTLLKCWNHPTLLFDLCASFFNQTSLKVVDPVQKKQRSVILRSQTSDSADLTEVQISSNFTYSERDLLAQHTKETANYLVYFAIVPAFQSQGIGSHLLSYCMHDLKSRAYLVETKSPRAMVFYQRNGFKVIGIRKRAFDQCHLLLKLL